MFNHPQAFGTVNGEKVLLYTIQNSHIRAEISSFGATIVRLYAHDRNDVLTNVVLGYDDVNRYVMNDSYMGAVIVPNANRTKGASFSISGVKYHMIKNEGKNNLHSDLKTGSSQRIWTVTDLDTKKITLELKQDDLELGFPGNRTFRVTYAVKDSSLIIRYEIKTDAETVFNPTNHAYFNLAGKSSILNHQLKICASQYTPLKKGSIPSDKVKKVAGTPFDFTEYKQIGKDISKPSAQLLLARGYDHNFLIDGYDGTLKLAASLYCPDNGIVMDTYSDDPGIQVYTSNYLENDKYSPHDGICLETQFTPNALNYEAFDKPLVKPGKTVRTTEYRFHTE